MSYTSKRALTTMGGFIFMFVAYIVYALGSAAPAPEDLKSWAVVLLVYVGGCIIVGIIIQIVFHIVYTIGVSVKEADCDEEKANRILKSSMLEDERYKLISLRSSNAAYKCGAFGFAAGLVALAAGAQAVFMLHIMVAAFAVGSIIEGCMTVHLNERGV